MDIAVLIAHEVKVAERNCDGLCADAEKAADIDDRRAAGADGVLVGHAAYPGFTGDETPASLSPRITV